MGTRDDPLWQALAAMRIAPRGAALTFTKRLARENGWSAHYAAAVVTEYKRFLYLAATGTDPVTPSEQVDQAWHLHLAYTRHYWEELCARIIGRPLHHGPTAGGGAEGRKYRGLYAATLRRYRATFGEAPPAEIWPATEQRFATNYQWVDRSRHFVLPRRSVSIAGVTVGAALLAACTALAAKSAKAPGAPAFKSFFGSAIQSNIGFVTFVICIVLLLAVVRSLKNRVRDRHITSQSLRSDRQRRRRESDDSATGSDISYTGWSGSDSSGAGSAAAAAGGAAFIAGGGEFGGSGADGDWDRSDGDFGGDFGGDSDSGSDSGGDSGCSSGGDSGCSGCGGGCGGD